MLSLFTMQAIYEPDVTIDYALNLFAGKLVLTSPTRKLHYATNPSGTNSSGTNPSATNSIELPLLSELCWLTIDPTKISEQIYADNSLKSYLSAVTLQHFDATIQALKTDFIFKNESDETIQNTILSLLNRLGLTDVLKQYARYLLTTSGGSELHG